MAVTLHQLIPTDFTEWYPPETLSPGELTHMGRPKFTQRDLVDWSMNDLRSLLIVDHLPAQWNGQIPQLSEPGFRITYMPRDISDYELATILASTDLYREHELDNKFRVQTALYTLQATKQRRQDPSDPAHLTVSEWRNVIENYLLNIACEAQCRLDYKRSCAVLKKKKRQSDGSFEVGDNLLHSSPSTSPLLRQAIMTSLSTSPNVPEYLRDRLLNSHKKKASLSLEEKQFLWVQVQRALYQRLGLDWQPDQFE